MPHSYTSPVAPLRFEPGQRFAGFVIDQRIGEGGMGEVYEVTHVQLRKKFALKILHRALNQDPTFAARFEREMITVSSLNHPNIVMTADGGSTDGYTWFSMTFVSGTDGQKAASAPPGGMPAARAVNIVEKVASALDYAHRRGVLHRDVKPANILLAADPDIDEEGVYLSDFGIAKVIGESTLTADGQRLLSIDFASPEQIDGTPLDPGSDIYALGATFYTLLTGRVPFPGDSWPVKVNRRFHGPVPQPSLAVPDLPPGLDAVVAKALASDPAHRYASCRELAADARRALTAPSPTEPPRSTEPASTATQQAVTQRATTKTSGDGEAVRCPNGAGTRTRRPLGRPAGRPPCAARPRAARGPDRRSRDGDRRRRRLVHHEPAHIDQHVVQHANRVVVGCVGRHFTGGVDPTANGRNQWRTWPGGHSAVVRAARSRPPNGGRARSPANRWRRPPHTR